VENSFNPYCQWLGLADLGRPPSYYELLQIPTGETDATLIAHAADKLSARVRSQRPGPHAARWQQLLDELAAAKRTLLDGAARERYDAGGRGASSPAQPQPPTKPTQPPSTAPGPARLFPPGYQSTAPAAAAGMPAEPASPVPGDSPAVPVTGVVNAAASSNLKPQASSLPAVPVAGVVNAAAGAANDPMAPFDPHQVSPTSAAQAARPSRAVPVLAPAKPLDVAGGVPPPHPSAAGDPMAAVDYGSAVGDPVPPAALQASAAATDAAVTETSLVTLSDRGAIPAGTKPRKLAAAATAAGLLAVVLLVAAAILAFLPRDQQPGPTIVQSPPVTGVPQTPAIGNGPQTKPPDKTAVRPAAEIPAVKPSPGPRPPVDPPPADPSAPPAVDPPDAAPPLPPDPNPPVSPPVVDPLPFPEPEPEPKIAPVPPPDPPPPPKPAPEQIAAVDRALYKARRALGRRDVAAARQALVSVKQIGEEFTELGDRLHRMSHLAVYVEGFWDAVRRELARLESGAEIVLPKTRVAVVENAGGVLTLRTNGRNREFAHDDLPSGLALALARRWLDSTDPRNKVLLGAFKAVNPTSDLNDARQLWREAAQDREVREALDPIMPVLDEGLRRP